MNALRGLGPKTFISYSFQDAALATQLRDHLTGAGYQVTMEDETSLANSRLPEVLPRRIAAAECFVQLRTPNSNKSYWVEQELDLAMKRHNQGDGFVLLPVVTDPVGLSDRAKEWVYFDASKEGLTTPLLDALVKAGIKSIRPIHLSANSPLVLDDGALDAALDSPTDRRRVLLDPDAFWFERSEMLIRWLQSRGDTAFARQETERRQQLGFLFERIDAGMWCLLRELRSRVERGLLRQADAHAIANSLYRYVASSSLPVLMQNVSIR